MALSVKTGVFLAPDFKPKQIITQPHDHIGEESSTMADENGTETIEAPKPKTPRKRPTAKKADGEKKTLKNAPYKLFKLDGKVLTLVVEVEAVSATAARSKADEKNKSLAGVPLVVVATRNMATLSTETTTRTSVKVVA